MIAGCRVSGEADTRAAVIAHVAKYHLDNRNSCAPVIRDIIHLTVIDGTLIVPGTEDSCHCTVELYMRILRECLAKLFLIICLELTSQLFHIIGIQVNIILDTLLCFLGINHFLKFCLFQTHDDIAEHHDKTSVGIIGKTLIARLLFNNLDNLIIHAKVQDGIHHARHGSTGTGTDRYKQRIDRIAKFHTGFFFQPLCIFINLCLYIIRNLFTVIIVLDACLSCNCVAFRHRKVQ